MYAIGAVRTLAAGAFDCGPYDDMALGSRYQAGGGVEGYLQRSAPATDWKRELAAVAAVKQGLDELRTTINQASPAPTGHEV